MAAYLAKRILTSKLSYTEVIKTYSEFKGDIDIILKAEGREDLIS